MSSTVTILSLSCLLQAGRSIANKPNSQQVAETLFSSLMTDYLQHTKIKSSFSNLVTISTLEESNIGAIRLNKVLSELKLNPTNALKEELKILYKQCETYLQDYFHPHSKFAHYSKPKFKKLVNNTKNHLKITVLKAKQTLINLELEEKNKTSLEGNSLIANIQQLKPSYLTFNDKKAKYLQKLNSTLLDTIEELSCKQETLEMINEQLSLEPMSLTLAFDSEALTKTVESIKLKINSLKHTINSIKNLHEYELLISKLQRTLNTSKIDTESLKTEFNLLNLTLKCLNLLETNKNNFTPEDESSTLESLKEEEKHMETIIKKLESLEPDTETIKNYTKELLVLQSILSI